MKIAFFDIKNFRRLSSCRIELDNETTIFVGANNSGKTSAFDAIYCLLTDMSKYTITDIPISMYDKINVVGEYWKRKTTNNLNHIDNDYCTHLDVWFDIGENELQYCYKFIPSLDWSGGKLGVRVQLSPDLQSIYAEFKLELSQNNSLKLIDFLDIRLKKYIKSRYFVLNPNKVDVINQESDDVEELDENPLKTLIKIDIISAQRNFHDISDKAKSNKLSDQLASYYDSQFNPKTQTVSGVSELYRAINEAEEKLSKALGDRYVDIIKDLSQVNYPNLGNPDISIKANIPVRDAIANSQSVRYKLPDVEHTLPENSNGLGLQNLVSMSFRLMQFRDDWVRKENKSDEILKDIEPIHLVLLEEPEAHLHPQSQMVFIRKAYLILRESDRAKLLTTQMILTTHSSHISYEVSYKNIRYFKREIRKCIPDTSIISLKGVFDKVDDDVEKIEKFVKRYLKLYHADIFFADGIILIEGSGEKILMSSFIENDISDLSKEYLSIIEIGGSHAHRLLPLLEKIKIPTLIISDIDPYDGNKKADKPEIGKGYTTSNPSIIKIIGINDFDKLLQLDEIEKTKENIHIVYQIPESTGDDPLLFYTFEDALVYANKDLNYDSRKTIIKNTFDKFLNYPDERKVELSKLNKAEFAIELLFEFDNEIKTPKYILEGLKWLQNQLK
jgi:predicted ATP-dependent endonuclease of OLD family